MKIKEDAAEEVKAVVQKVKEKAEKIVSTISIEQSAAKKILCEAEPELLAAETALQVRECYLFCIFKLSFLTCH